MVSKKYETFILVNTFCLMKTTKDLVHGKIFNRQNITRQSHQPKYILSVQQLQIGTRENIYITFQKQILKAFRLERGKGHP